MKVYFPNDNSTVFIPCSSGDDGCSPAYDGPTAVTPGATDVVLPTRHTTVTQDITVIGDPDLIPANIVQNVDIFGVQGEAVIPSLGALSVTANGTYIAPPGTGYDEVDVAVSGGAPVLQTKSVSYTPTESAQTQTVTPDNGYDGLSSVAVSVGAISDTYVGSGITRRDDDDLTASGPTVSVPVGYYESSASKAVASGTAGTPTATKGAVSNHSVSVTPSVTNSAGYIASETKTGTAVTVSASELVSGTKSITANGTGIDVTDYAAVDVNVSGGGGGGLTTVASGTFTGTGATQIPINVGTRMPQTDFWVKFKAQSNTEFPYNTGNKPAYVYAILNSDMGHFNLTTVGNYKEVVSDLSYDVNNGGTISHVSAGSYIADLDYIRETSSTHLRPNNFLISRKSDHFEVILMQSNPSYAYPSGITYDWEVVYFGSNAATDIIEIL